LKPAKMGRGEQLWGDEELRGDSLCWITPDLCKEYDLHGVEEFLRRITAENEVLKSHLGLTFEFNMQFALYPGKGEGYNRHKDAFPKESAIDTISEAASSILTSRQLTMLLYLNRDWETEDGGQLRVFTAPGAVIEGTELVGEPFTFWGVNGYDIFPLFGRMVIFRSEIVEHAVLPCHRERQALTFWAHGTGPKQMLSDHYDSEEAKPSPIASSVFRFSNEHEHEDDVDGEARS